VTKKIKPMQRLDQLSQAMVTQPVPSEKLAKEVRFGGIFCAIGQAPRRSAPSRNASIAACHSSASC
jgi:hypothetical protein